MGSSPRSATLVSGHLLVCAYSASLPPLVICCDFLLGGQPSTTLCLCFWEIPAISALLGEDWPFLGSRPNQHIPSSSHSDWFKRRHKTRQSILVKSEAFSRWGLEEALYPLEFLKVVTALKITDC